MAPLPSTAIRLHNETPSNVFVYIKRITRTGLGILTRSQLRNMQELYERPHVRETYTYGNE